MRKNQNFWAMITALDDAIRTFDTNLTTLGLRSKTIFIFMTDNGSVNLGGYNGGMKGMKASGLEGGHRVPFFLRYPGFELVQPQSQVDYLVSHIDVLPTLVDVLGLSKGPQVLDGTSFKHLIKCSMTSSNSACLNNANTKASQLEDRVLIVESQNRMDPNKWAPETVVMKGYWRLMKNGKTLYNVERYVCV